MRILMLHGYGGDPSQFDAIKSAINAAFKAGSLSIECPALPGHGVGLLNLESAKIFSSALGSYDLGIGFSLGARILEWNTDIPQVLISPPDLADFNDKLHRREILKALHPRNVNESAPMRGLADILTVEPPTPNQNALVLYGENDLTSVQKRVVRLAYSRVQKISDVDHVAITSHIRTCASVVEELKQWL